jgi:hypothetical protein
MLAAAAMAVAAAVAVWLFLIPPARPLVDQGLATVTQARFLLQNDPNRQLAIGQSLQAGRVARRERLFASELGDEVGQGQLRAADHGRAAERQEEDVAIAAPRGVGEGEPHRGRV